MRPQKRKEERVSRSAEVIILEKAPVAGRANWAASVNVSPSGLCMYTNVPVMHGQNYTLTSEDLWFTPRLARVAWSTKIGDEIYQAGFFFV
jgi:hypothetical protein